jgi:hypothetical protein
MFLMAGGSLRLPSAAIFGALLLIPMMVGVIFTKAFVVPASHVIPLLLLLAAWAAEQARRHQRRPS